MDISEEGGDRTNYWRVENGTCTNKHISLLLSLHMRCCVIISSSCVCENRHTKFYAYFSYYLPPDCPVYEGNVLFVCVCIVRSCQRPTLLMYS